MVKGTAKVKVPSSAASSTSSRKDPAEEQDADIVQLNIFLTRAFQSAKWQML